ncbi:MAG TPA: DUF58 domain-containing protein [Streptosporangiaceae bacterium]|nr:DUF58 domain-containing protein [Streptosporangiaceae bacterium]
MQWLFRPDPLITPRGAVTARGVSATFLITPQRWGRRRAGTVDLVLRDRLRLSEGRARLALPWLDCYPRPGHQRTRVVLSRLPNWLGEHVARRPGDGIEFAGVREYAPGDRQHQINWPASTRRGRLMVNVRAAERSQDVVLLIDATCDVGEPGASALDLGLRGAAAAAQAYLDARDRVGRRCRTAPWSWRSARCSTSGSSRPCATCRPRRPRRGAGRRGPARRRPARRGLGRLGGRAAAAHRPCRRRADAVGHLRLARRAAPGGGLDPAPGGRVPGVGAGARLDVVPGPAAHQPGRRQPRPSRRIAFCLRIFARTSVLMPSRSKSRSQRSGVSSG